MNRPLLFAFALLTATACGLGGDTDKTDSTASNSDTDVTNYYPACEYADGDEFYLYGVAISGDTLQVDVSYSGGCETHDFTLCWPEEIWLESYPVQTSLEILHDAHGDACEAELDETLELDLLPLQQAYLDAYGGSTGEIEIHLLGETVNYSF